MQKPKAETKYHAKKGRKPPQLHFPGQKGKFCAEKVSFRYTIKSGDWKDADLTAVNMTRTMISEFF